MRPSLTASLVALTLALPVLAQAPAGAPLDAEGFDRYTQGRTLSFSFEGTPYGIEEYLPNRRVRWAFVGQECNNGVWYERNGAICFLYENAPENEQCWHFFLDGDRLRGVFQGPDGPSTELYEVGQSADPLTCAGPGVGV